MQKLDQSNQSPWLPYSVPFARLNEYYDSLPLEMKILISERDNQISRRDKYRMIWLLYRESDMAIAHYGSKENIPAYLDNA